MNIPKPGPPKNSSGLIYYHRPSEQHERAATSRCCTPPHDEKLIWHTYWHMQDSAIIDIATWLSDLPEEARDRALGQLEILLEDAARGGLDPKEPSEPIKAINQGEDFFELRLTFNDFGAEDKLFRQYHAEPIDPDLDNLLVTSHAHFKQVVSDNGKNLSRHEISQHQTLQMQQAVNRFSLGKSSMWGLNVSDSEPLHPIDALENLLEMLDLL